MVENPEYLAILASLAIQFAAGRIVREMCEVGEAA